MYNICIFLRIIGSLRMHWCKVINIRQIVFVMCACACVRLAKATIYLVMDRKRSLYTFFCVQHLNCIYWQNCDVDRITTTNNYDLCLCYVLFFFVGSLLPVLLSRNNCFRRYCLALRFTIAFQLNFEITNRIIFSIGMMMIFYISIATWTKQYYY